MREKRGVLETSTDMSVHTATNAICAFKSAHHQQCFQEEYLSSGEDKKDTPFQMEINRLRATGHPELPNMCAFVKLRAMNF